VSDAWAEIADDHARADIEDRDHGVRVPQAILARPTGVQPSPDWSGQPVEDRHASRPDIIRA
jgi:hypothetical protein